MSERFETDTVVIGAGVVGLAVARALSKHSEVLLLERNAHYGMETSSRNSEVIHAGIYYPKDSLKAQFCVQGKAMLYQYCEANAVEFKQCGKLIVAANAQQNEMLRSIKAKANQNGVLDIEELSSEQALEMEPSVSCEAALFSPSTGIIDSHGLMTQLLADFEHCGGQLVLNTEVVAIESHGKLLVRCADGSELMAKTVVNAAGLAAVDLGAPAVAPDHRKQSVFAKGSYFSYSGPTDFKHLIYPVPEPGGLGIHLTLDMQGQARFGPDVEWLDVDSAEAFRRQPSLFEVEEHKRENFYRAIRTYWEGVEKDRLVPDYSGIRPKLSEPEVAASDFMIQGPRQHGVKGLFNLLGIESPGLTSSLAMAAYLSKQLF